jgi:tetratricopeptide (TPR) repeat protein
VDRGILAYDDKQYPEALGAFQEALRIDPENVNALYYQGLTQAGLQQLPAAQASLERARELAPADQDVLFQLAVVLFGQQQFDRAEPLFRQVVAAQPKRQNVGYYLGVIEYRRQNYREALRLLQGNVPSDDSFAQLSSFYAGLSLSALGFQGAARAEIEEAIRRQPVSPLTGAAERFRDVLGAAAKSERKYRLEAKLGFFYDDNVSANPSIANDPAVALARRQDHRSTGELGYIRFEYQPLRLPDWELGLNASVLGNVNNDVSGYNVGTYGLGSSLTYKSTLWGRQAIWNLGLSYDYVTLDYASYTNRYTIGPALTYVWGQEHVTQPVIRFQAKDYMGQELTTTADNRDSLNYMAGFTHFLLFGGGRHYLKAGYQFDYESAKGANWSYFGNRFLAGLQYMLPWWDLRYKLDGDLHLRGYTSLHNYLPLATAPALHRWDRDLNVQTSLSKDFANNITVGLEYLYNRAFSNLEVYDYSRNVVTLSVAWKY